MGLSNVDGMGPDEVPAGSSLTVQLASQGDSERGGPGSQTLTSHQSLLTTTSLQRCTKTATTRAHPASLVLAIIKEVV